MREGVLVLVKQGRRHRGLTDVVPARPESVTRQRGYAQAVARVLVATALALVCAVPCADAATTRLDRSGTVRLDGRKIFPIVLSKGPELGSTTPGGADALAEVASAGVNFLRTGPGGATWTSKDIAEAIAWNREAAARGLYTWVNLSSLSRAQPGTWRAALLRKVIGSLAARPVGHRAGHVEGRRRAVALPDHRSRRCGSRTASRPRAAIAAGAQGSARPTPTTCG